MKKICFFFFFTCICITILAQVPDIRLERYSTQDGLSQNSTGALLQDSRGFLWVGTSWGLNRYDGRQMKQYNKIGPGLLPDLHINSLAEDRAGNIWIGTENGLSCLDPYTQKFTNFSEGKTPQNIPAANCNVYIDKNDRVWVSTDNRLASLNRETGIFTVTPINTVGRDIRKNKYIDCFFEDSKGRFWLATSFGAKLFNRENNTYYSYTDEAGSVSKTPAVQGFFEDREGNLWAGTWNGGILKFNPDENKFNYYQVKTKSYNESQTVHDINSIILNNKYYLLLASEEGLLLADPEKIKAGTSFIEKLVPDMQDEYSSSGKMKILKDRQGNYWISSYDGLFKIDISRQAFQWKQIPGLPENNIPIFHVIPSVKDPLKSFILTTQKSWWEYSLADHSFSPWPLPKTDQELLGNINNYVIDKDGYWFTSQVGVGFYNVRSNTVKNIALLLDDAIENRIRTGMICKDNLGRVWFTVARSGARIYDPLTGKITRFLADSTQQGSLYASSVFDMKPAGDKSILFATGRNIYDVNPTDLSFKIIKPAIDPGLSITRFGPRKILITRDNRILLLAPQCIYEYKNQQLRQLYPQKGPADFMMDYMLQDTLGNIWVNTNMGLFRSDDSLQRWTAMSAKAGGINSDNILELFCNSNNQFIATAFNRIGIFAVDYLKKNETGPAMIINRVRTGEKEKYMLPFKTEAIRLSYRDAIELEMSAINFINERGNRIYYKLEGWDDDWKELIGNPVVRYEQLPAGTYTFTGKAINEDGVWGEETKLSFTVAPPFWKTWWFISLIVFLTAVSLFSIYRYRVKQVIRQERMRSRIATDLHDDIGSTLSSISFYSEAIKQQTEEHLPQLTPMLNKMGETSRDMVSNMSDIVWAINPNNDSVEKMINRMQAHAGEMCTVKNVQLYFKSDEKLNELQLGMEQRRNIYMIFKEALNNSLKYAGAKNCWIHLSFAHTELKMIIKDDGKGFILEKQYAETEGGNGLKNMNTRAKEIDGELLVQSSAGNGTTVTLVLKIT